MNPQTDQSHTNDHHLSPSSGSSGSSGSSSSSVFCEPPQHRKWSTSAKSNTAIEYLLSEASLATNEKWRQGPRTLHKAQCPPPSLLRPQLSSQGSTEQLLYPLLLQLGAHEPHVRNAARQVLIALVDQHSTDDHRLEHLLETIIGSGLAEWSSIDSEISLNTMRVLPTLLERILIHSERNISPRVMGRLVESLAKRLIQVTHQKQALHALTRIKRVIGETLFDHFLETHYPRVKRDFDLLSDVYGAEENDENDDENSSTEDEDEEADESEDVIAKMYDEYGNEIARSPNRRVTFGGEVVKIRTPDSDATITTTTNTTATTTTNNNENSVPITQELIAVTAESDSEPQRVRKVPAPRRPSRIPLPIHPALHEPQWRKHAFRPPSLFSDRLWSSSDDVHLNVDVDVDVLLGNIGLDLNYMLNERDSSTTSSLDGYCHVTSSNTNQKRHTNEADWNERAISKDELDEITTKNDRTKRAVSSDFSLHQTNEPNIPFNHSPVSESKFNVLPTLSRLPIRLKPKLDRSSMRHQRDDVTASLPSLNDINDGIKGFRSIQKEYRKEINSTHRSVRSVLENDISLQQAKTLQPSSPIGAQNKVSANLPNDGENMEDTVDKRETLNKEDSIQLIMPTKFDPVIIERKPQHIKLDYLAVNSSLERKPGVKLKRSLTKEIQIPRSSYNTDSADLGPFEHPRDAMQKILLQFSSNEWELIIQALQGVIRLSKHHSKQLSSSLHPYAIAVSKEIKNLRSQVARAACSCAENIFRNVKNIADQNIEELSNSLFLRCMDTNKFLREDTNKALDAMIDSVKFSKSLTILTQKGANHVNALVRASTGRLLLRLLKLHGSTKILSLPKEKRELIFNTVLKFLTDGNVETRLHAKNIVLFFADNGRVFNSFRDPLPQSAIVSIDKFLSTAKK